MDGAHSSLIDFSRTVAVGSLPIGITALSLIPRPVTVIVHVPAASARLALSGAVERNAAAPISRPHRACRRQRCRGANRFLSLWFG